MLNLYHSNRAEALLEQLAAVLAEPLSDPLAPETVVVQNQGMARWLSLRLAERHGVAANQAFPLPASFVWELFRGQLSEVPRDAGYDRETLLWRLMAVLPGQLEAPELAPLQRYLADGHRVLKRYQLAARVADLFDQYLVYRPELIARWEAGETGDDPDERWQALLWRALLPGSEAQPLHRARLLTRFLERAQGPGLDPAPLPQRVCLFGLTAMAPAYLAVLAAVAEHSAVHLFLLNPSLDYWGDIAAERDLARLRALWRRHGKDDVSAYFEIGNPLLASLGKQGRDFLDQLHAFPCDDAEAFVVPAGDGVLATLQRDVLLLRRRGGDGEPPLPLSPADDSLQVHACHGPMREVQVLHDRLLDLLERLPGLTPQDIVVMAPDIDAYAPHVDAVFSAVPRERHIPWAVADRRAAGEQPLVQTVLALLDLPESRLPASEVLSLLEQPAAQRRLHLDESGFERIRAWVDEVNIRWGGDGAMREALGLPPGDANTWAFGLRRLLLGYAMAPDAAPFAGILPHADVEGGDARLLGPLAGFLERLGHWRDLLGRPHSARRWVGLVNRLLDDFLVPDEEEEQALQTVRDAFDALAREAARAGLEEPLERAVVREHLAGCLEQASGSERFLTGRVTFCNMVPMRSIPFRVVCLLGMNDRDYPRAQHPPGFDLIARQPRRGDRSRREDDRYLFLEALLSARDVLHISYTGRDLRDNSVKVPSVLVNELLDTVEAGFTAQSGSVRGHLVIEHPLQPFSRRYFGAEPGLFSYAAEWLPEGGERAPPAPFFPLPLDQAEAEWYSVELDALVRFLRHPARYLLRERLRLALELEQAAPRDEEAFVLDGLEAYRLREDTLARLLAGETAEACRARAAAAGVLPQAPFDALAWEAQGDRLEAMADAVRPRIAAVGAPLEVALEHHGVHLSGWLRGVSADGLLRYRPAALKPKDRVGLWVEHLALNVAAAPGLEPVSEFVAEDRVLRLAPVADAERHLRDLLALYWRGLHEPLPFFPAPAWAYASAIAKGKAESEALAAAAKDWDPGADAYIATAFRGRDPFDGMPELARTVFEPMLAATDEEKR